MSIITKNVFKQLLYTNYKTLLTITFHYGHYNCNECNLHYKCY